MNEQHCRFCGAELTQTFLDLGLSPLANEYLTPGDCREGQFFYPLVVRVCPQCFLTQAEEYQTPEHIFRKYNYFSSYSTIWLEHCRAYVEMIIPRLGLNANSRVLEIACNDGYLLQYFLERNIPAKGIDPAENVVAEARKKGIEADCAFFQQETAAHMAQNGERFDLVIGNNVLAHVPNIKGFVAGLPVVLAERGTVTVEFPHLMRLIQDAQFDTIYHEHFSYLSLGTVEHLFRSCGLKVYDVEQLPTHGGSLRVYAAHLEDESHPISDHVADLLEEERRFGLNSLKAYQDFAPRVEQIKYDTLSLLADLKRQKKTVMAFGAAAKGNTFLNYCGIKRDMVEAVFDSNVHKQGLYLPGSLIPILAPERLEACRPDYLLILPWNLAEEIAAATTKIRDWGGKYITCIPQVQIF